ncbi:hypothetical protein [Actinomadura sp. NPDC049753]|uniref:hypothetical protein n=1 Tax=Actinomadura sp. NPDC049753 TaxID=3154739 RepID=UPI003447DCFA
MLAQVSAGLGVAVSARASTTTAVCPVAIRPLSQGQRTLTMELVWPKERKLPESVTRFLTFAQEQLGSSGERL